MAIILLLSSVQVYAELLTPRQQNMIKAVIDIEYNRLKGEQPNPSEQTKNEIFLLSGKNLSDPQIKEKTFQQVMQFTQLSAQAPISRDRAYHKAEVQILQSFTDTTQLQWFLFSIILLDQVTPKFICQKNNDLCQAFMTDTNAFDEVFRSPSTVDPHHFNALTNKICSIEKDCSVVRKHVISNQLKQATQNFDENRAKATMEQQLKRLNIEYN